MIWRVNILLHNVLWEEEKSKKIGVTLQGLVLSEVLFLFVKIKTSFVFVCLALFPHIKQQF